MIISNKWKAILNKPESLPEFTITNKEGVKEIIEKEFSYSLMTEISTMGAGESFGELALMRNQK